MSYAPKQGLQEKEVPRHLINRENYEQWHQLEQIRSQRVLRIETIRPEWRSVIRNAFAVVRNICRPIRDIRTYGKRVLALALAN